MNNKSSLANRIVIVGCACFAVLTQAQEVSIQDGSSTAWVDLGSSRGMYSWDIGGQSYLTQQWFRYRNGMGAPNQAINELGIDMTQTGWAGNQLAVTYKNSQLEVQVYYVLNSAGNNVADIMENIVVRNIGTTPIAGFSFFQYSNFDLSPNDYVEVQDSGGGAFDRAIQLGGLNMLMEEVESGTTASPAPSRYAAGEAAALLAAIESGANLNNTLFYQGGDAAWAFQWNFDLAPGQEVNVLKDKLLKVTPVPEPAVASFAVVGLVSLMLRRRVS